MWYCWVHQHLEVTLLWASEFKVVVFSYLIRGNHKVEDGWLGLNRMWYMYLIFVYYWCLPQCFVFAACLDRFFGDISAFLRMLSHVWDSSALWRATKQGDLPSGTSDIIRFVWLGRKNSLDFWPAVGPDCCVCIACFRLTSGGLWSSAKIGITACETSELLLFVKTE